jgi:prophage tail gpP-like protein
VTERNRALVELAWDSDGFVIDAWDSLALRDSFIDPLGDLSFSVGPPRKELDSYRQRLVKGEAVTLRINGTLQGKFVVQESVMAIGINGVSFSLSCQTPLCVAYEASVDPRVSYGGANNVSVSEVVLAVMAPFGFEAVAADALANVAARTGKPIGNGVATPNLKDLTAKEMQAQDGETAYQFAHRIFSRYGVQLRVANDGTTLLLEAPDYEQETSYTAAQTFDTGPVADYFLAEPAVVVHSGNRSQYSECTVIGVATDDDGTRRTGAPRVTVEPSVPIVGVASSVVTETQSTLAERRALARGDSTTTKVEVARPAYQSRSSPYKPKIIKDKNSASLKRCGSTAKLGLSLGCETGFCVTGTVDGFVSQTGRVWTVGTIARVVVEAYGLDERMFLLEVTRQQDATSGQRTALKFIPLYSLVLGDIAT